MHPEDIKAGLRKLRLTSRELAQDLGVTPGMVCQVINRQANSARIENEIASRLGLPASEVWTWPVTGWRKRVGKKAEGGQ